MTDLVPQEVTPDSRTVTPKTADTERVVAQLEKLGDDEFAVICFAKPAFDALQAYFDGDRVDLPQNITAFRGRDRHRTVTGYRVWHYSNYGANADKVDELERQLQYLDGHIQV